MTDVCERIEYLRKERSISQAELAKRLGISRSAVNAWEMGISKPHIDHVIMLTKIFNTTADFLLDIDKANYYIDISELPDKEKKIIVDLINALKDRKKGAAAKS